MGFILSQIFIAEWSLGFHYILLKMTIAIPRLKPKKRRWVDVRLMKAKRKILFFIFLS